MEFAHQLVSAYKLHADCWSTLLAPWILQSFLPCVRMHSVIAVTLNAREGPFSSLKSYLC